MVTTALHKGKKMYSWTILDVFSLLGIKTSPHKEEVIVPCPFCNGKRFAMNQRISAGHCFNCEQAADSASYYAQTMGLSIEEARRETETLSTPSTFFTALSTLLWQAAQLMPSTLYSVFITLLTSPILK